jgi:glycosyltransferase involved in cell wall biosynthesis
MKENEPLISVIVPIYNVEKYLSRCIESIINQTYKNLEIILVDDGSPDSSPAICDAFAEKDSRVNVIHKKNGGVSEARNVAIDVSQGVYILFVDGDDFMAPDMIELLCDTLRSNKADVSSCGYINHYKVVEAPLDQDNKERVLSGELALEDMLYQRSITTSPWGKLYKKELFNEIRYPLGAKNAQDLAVTYRLLSRSKTVVINSSAKYYYQQREDSAVRSSFTSKRMDALGFAKNILVYIENAHPSLISAAKNRLFMEALFIIVQIPHGKNISFSKEWRECKEVIRRCKKDVLLDRKSKIIYRLYALISFAGCRILSDVYRLKSDLRDRYLYKMAKSRTHE